MKRLQECLNSIDRESLPQSWETTGDVVKQEHAHFQKLISQPSSLIYGANTLVGHKDKTKLTASDFLDFSYDLLSSHMLGGEPWYSPYAAKCISYTKVYSLSNGGSGISPQLYNIILECVSDPSFSPQIPQNCTYSSGDVIPGAHWANAVFQYAHAKYSYDPMPGEAMALLNGSYIHLGYSISLLKKLENLWVLFVETTKLNSRLTGANKSNFYDRYFSSEDGLDAIHYISNYLKSDYSDYKRQDPISIRSSPFLIRTLTNSISQLYREIDYLLGQPSGNPLFDLDIDYPISQGSFLAPSLSIKTEAVIESILFVMWACVSRTSYLLSGEVAKIPSDASNPSSRLQFIQYPKLMLSILDKCRQDYGRRIFSSGSQTSKGIEDLWTYGVNVSSQLEDLYADGIKLFAIELYVLVRCMQIFEIGDYEFEGVWACAQQQKGLMDIVDELSSHVEEKGSLGQVRELFLRGVGIQL